jgi:hypothetical protein
MAAVLPPLYQIAIKFYRDFPGLVGRTMRPHSAAEAAQAQK